MGFPADEADKLWSDLYNYQAKKLHDQTFPIFSTKKYLIHLDVWHKRHCLNVPKWDNNRETEIFRHWGMFLPNHI
ncbi:hypothetical protein EYZ11_006485 [Aspergillus tanneri]|uniref:Uncharacterized protein n=1 Tax=Aspergillus tanneri TaxID=1220188 RepID=A0A4S3JFE5_9EURO|nr:hypothetical protein EYZ11_006485 [Aspergillus tanneri]